MRHEGGRLCLAAVLLLLTSIGNAAAISKRLTPEAAIETSRFMIDASTISARNPNGSVSISPSGRWWVARLVRGDVAANGVWMEMFAGRADQPKLVAPRKIDHWFSTGLGAGEGRAGPNLDTVVTTLTWVSEDTVAFAWSDAQGQRQVIGVNLASAEVRQLTQHSAGIETFDAAADGTVIFSAPADREERSLAQTLRDGFVIEPHTDAASLILGYVNKGSVVDRLWRSQWFVRDRTGAVRPLSIAGRAFEDNPYERVWMAPNARRAVIASIAPVLSQGWSRYTDEDYEVRLRHARDNPRSLLGRLVYQLFVVDIASGENRPLWDTVIDADAAHCAWSRDGNSLLVGPTFLPVTEQATAAALAGRSVAVIDVPSGEWQALPIGEEEGEIRAVHWVDATTVGVELDRDGRTHALRFNRDEGHWRRVEDHTSAATEIRFVLRQSLDAPPVLLAERAGGSSLLIDPNPHLAQQYSLGSSAYREGTLDDARRWRALIFYPPRFDRARRYPLVMQSVYGGGGAQEFTLFGSMGGYGLGPSIIPPYPGRLLAQHEIVVAQIDIEGEDASSTPEEPALRASAFAKLAQALVAEGFIDEQRVGLLGFSRNGYFVEYALTHPQRSYAAAVAADHFDAGYVAQTLLGYEAGGADVNGGAPFADALPQWLERAPGFNVDRIDTPLLQIEQSHAVLGAVLRWETYSRLRYLKKPVELWIIPNADLGVHNAQNPEQILAQQTRVIDWFRFWLKQEEDVEPSKREQYERWRELRRLNDVRVNAPEHE
jgi:Prolyl oligopeptidase family